MKLCSKLSSTAACLLLAFLNSTSAPASTIAGAFNTDDQVFQYAWTLSQSSTVVASTNSYATGGFVPVLSLFNASTGAFIAGDGADASCSHGRMADATTGICNDAYLTASLAKGSYVVALSEFFNYPAGSNLSNGFTETGSPDFTASACPGMSGPFLETDLAPCVQRSGNYSLQLSANVATPEPATGWLFLPLVALAAFSYRFKKKAVVKT